jgi:hypothetical protein
MEALVKTMQNTTTGVPVKPQKLFLTTISNAFTGLHSILYLKLIEKL